MYTTLLISATLEGVNCGYMYLNIVAIIIVIKVLTDKTDKVRGSDSCNCPSDSSQCQDIVGDLND